MLMATEEIQLSRGKAPNNKILFLDIDFRATGGELEQIRSTEPYFLRIALAIYRLIYNSGPIRAT